MKVLQHHVEEMPEDEVTDLFRLAMLAILPEDVGNVRFGPEATRDRKQQGDKDVYSILIGSCVILYRRVIRTVSLWLP
jgi:hypothetical protein